MADKENCVRITRAAAKKRAAAGLPLLQDLSPPVAKKARVVLGELSSLSNVPRSLPPETQPAKPKTRAAKKREQRKVAETVDANVDDPQLCAPYASDIYQYLHSMEMEPKRRPLHKFIEAVQSDIKDSVRGTVVDWLVDVAEEYKLVSDTLYLTISYIDRYLSHCDIKRDRLKLVGVSCMLIASKYEETSPPHVEEFCYRTDNPYTKEEVIKMESDVLKFLMFEMGNPTIKTFLRRFVRVALEDSKVQNLQFEFLSNYLAELSLVDYGCVQFLPSIIAASVVFVARLTIYPDVHPWTAGLQCHSGYKPLQLKECVQAIHELQMSKRASNLVAIRKKYKRHKFKVVSSLCPPPEIPAIYFEDAKL